MMFLLIAVSGPYSVVATNVRQHHAINPAEAAIAGSRIARNTGVTAS